MTRKDASKPALLPGVEWRESAYIPALGLVSDSEPLPSEMHHGENGGGSPFKATTTVPSIGSL